MQPTSNHTPSTSFQMPTPFRLPEKRTMDGLETPAKKKNKQINEKEVVKCTKLSSVSINEKKVVEYTKLSSASIKLISQRSFHLTSKFDADFKQTAQKIFKIEGRDLEIELLALNLDSQNQNHNVYRFVDGQPDLAICTKESDGSTVEKTIILAETILKIPKPTLNNQKKTQLMKTTINAINHFIAAGVPLAEVFAHPENFVDSTNAKNGGFYLYKKMTVSIRGENKSKGIENPLKDPVVLKFVKEWLTKSANDKYTYIADFRPDNVMKDIEGPDGHVFVIDPDLNLDKQDFEESLHASLRHWAGESREFIEQLTEDFEDTALKEKMLNSFDQNIQPKYCING